MKASIQNNNKQSTQQQKKKEKKTAHIKQKHSNKITNTPYTKQQQSTHKMKAFIIIMTIISKVQILKKP